MKNITAHYRLLLDEIIERRPSWRAPPAATARSSRRTGQDLPPRRHRLLRNRPQDRHRRLRFAQIRRRRPGRGQQGGPGLAGDRHRRNHEQRRRHQLHEEARSGGRAGQYRAASGQDRGRRIAVAGVSQRRFGAGRPQAGRGHLPQPRSRLGTGAAEKVRRAQGGRVDDAERKRRRPGTEHYRRGRRQRLRL